MNKAAFWLESRTNLVKDGADIVGRAVYTAYVNERFRDYEGTDADGDLWGRTDGGPSYLVKDVAISDEIGRAHV